MDPSILDDLLARFRNELSRAEPPAGALDRLLGVTGARAAGVWRLAEDHLVLVGFRAVADMPQEVREGFRQATTRVPLERTDLGIVRAARSGAPSPATRAEGEPDAGGSASWLRRFGAEQSLSVAVRREGKTVAVLAVSCPYTFDEESDTHRLLEELAARLGELAR